MAPLGSFFKGRRATPTKKTYDDLEVAVSSIKKTPPSRMLVPLTSNPFANVSAIGTPMDRAPQNTNGGEIEAIELQRLHSPPELPTMNRSFSAPPSAPPQIDGAELGLRFPFMAGVGADGSPDKQSPGNTGILPGSHPVTPTRTYIDLQNALPESPLTKFTPRAVLASSVETSLHPLPREDTIDDLVGGYGGENVAISTSSFIPTIGRTADGFFEAEGNQVTQPIAFPEKALLPDVPHHAAKFFNEGVRRTIHNNRHVGHSYLTIGDLNIARSQVERPWTPSASNDEDVMIAHSQAPFPGSLAQITSTEPGSRMPNDELIDMQGWNGSLSDISGGVIQDGDLSREMSVLEFRKAISEIEASMKSGPGSSQTPSSSYQTLSDGRRRPLTPVKYRPGTPPGLFGRNQSILIPAPPVVRRPSLQRVTSAAGIQSDSRLGRVVAAGVESDWATDITDEQGGLNNTNAATACSIDDQSDSHNISTALNQVHRPILQAKTHARYNATWKLQRNIQTGALTIIPADGAQRVGERRHDLTYTKDYQHPPGLSFQHSNPLEGPSIAKLNINQSSDEAEQSRHDGSASRYHSRQKGKRASEQTADFPYDDDLQWMLSDNGLSVASNQSEGQIERMITAAGSSAWMSTVDEGASDEFPMPQQTRQGSFSKVNYLGRHNNVTGTPGGTGAKEVGSSLADASSPYAMPCTTPIGHQEILQRLSSDSDTSPDVYHSIGAAFTPELRHHHKHASSSVYESTSIKSQLRKPLTPRSTTHRHRRSQITPANGDTMSPRSLRRRSQGYPAPYSRGASQDGCYIQSTPLLMDTVSPFSQEQASPIARKGAANEASSRYNKSASKERAGYRSSRLTINLGQPGPAINTIDNEEQAEDEFPARPEAAKLPHSQREHRSGKAQARPQRSLLPIARPNSPHVHPWAFAPSRGSDRREASLSILVAVLCCLLLVPSLLYGFGQLDSVMTYLSGGEFTHFRRKEKRACLGFCVTVIIALGLVIPLTTASSTA